MAMAVATPASNIPVIILKCYCCKEIPWCEVYQCFNTHTICAKCYQTLTKCPKCDVKLAQKRKIRSSMEHLLNMLEYECPNKERGCEEKLTRNEIPTHQEACGFRLKLVQLCKNIGFKCDFSVSSAGIQEAVQHFQEVHGCPLHTSKNLTIALENVTGGDFTSSRNSVWSPVIVKLGEEDDFKVFIVFGLFVGKEKILKVHWWSFGNTDSMEAKFRISAGNSDSAPEIRWRDHPRGNFIEEFDMLGSSFKVPFQFLQQLDLAEFLVTITMQMIINGNDEVAESNVNPILTTKLPLLPMNANPSMKSNTLKFLQNYVCKKCDAKLENIFYASLIHQLYTLCHNCVTSGRNIEERIENRQENIYAVVTSSRHERILRKLGFADEQWDPVINDKMVNELIPHAYKGEVGMSVLKPGLAQCPGPVSICKGGQLDFFYWNYDDIGNPDSEFVYICLECEDHFMFICCKDCVEAECHKKTGHLLLMLSHPKHILYFKLDCGRYLKRFISSMRNETASVEKDED